MHSPDSNLHSSSITFKFTFVIGNPVVACRCRCIGTPFNEANLDCPCTLPTHAVSWPIAKECCILVQADKCVERVLPLTFCPHVPETRAQTTTACRIDRIIAGTVPLCRRLLTPSPLRNHAVYSTSRAAGIRSGIAPAMLCHPDTRQPLPHFPNRSRSSHRPSFAITPSTPPLHGHQSASALGSMHRTSWAAGIRSGISPAMLCHPDTR